MSYGNCVCGYYVRFCVVVFFCFFQMVPMSRVIEFLMLIEISRFLMQNDYWLTFWNQKSMFVVKMGTSATGATFSNRAETIHSFMSISGLSKSVRQKHPTHRPCRQLSNLLTINTSCIWHGHKWVMAIMYVVGIMSDFLFFCSNGTNVKCHRIFNAYWDF